MAWFYTVLLAGCSAGIVAVGAAMTHRLFREEALTRADGPDGRAATDGTR